MRSMILDLLAVPYAEANCWAIAQRAAARFGKSLRDAESYEDPSECGEMIKQGSEEAGDLVLMEKAGSGVDHVGLVVEPGLMLHAINDQKPVLHRIRRAHGVHSIWRLPSC